MKNKRSKEHYSGINVLRVIACLCIIMTHVYANNNYQISGFVYNEIIPSFRDFVFLFMTISSFSMCCGYYDKVINKEVDWIQFYKKRISKILPFYAILIFIDLIISFSNSSLCEAIVELTLLHGFVPGYQDFSVIGVGWFLGLIFIFYLIFPFFCTLIKDKKSAWISFAISILLNFTCFIYFGINKENILYSGCYFILGGIIYLYRKEIKKTSKTIAVILTCLAIVLYYSVKIYPAITCLLVTCAFMILAINNTLDVFENKITKFLSGISLEIYLSHMAIFRAIEKIGFNTRFGNGWMQYLITTILVVIGSLAYSFVIKHILEIIINKVKLLNENINTK